MDSFISIPIVGKDDAVVSKTSNKNTHYVETVRVLSTSEALNFPTANSVVKIREKEDGTTEEKVHAYFSSATVAALLAAAVSPIPGVASSGQTTLVAGTLVITIPGLTTSNKGYVSLVAQGGTSTTVYAYKGVCTTNTLTITAVDVTNVKVATDTSVVNYFVL